MSVHDGTPKRIGGIWVVAARQLRDYDVLPQSLLSRRGKACILLGLRQTTHIALRNALRCAPRSRPTNLQRCIIFFPSLNIQAPRPVSSNRGRTSAISDLLQPTRSDQAKQKPSRHNKRAKQVAPWSIAHSVGGRLLGAVLRPVPRARCASVAGRPGWAGARCLELMRGSLP
jgi:hypothetical protein